MQKLKDKYLLERRYLTNKNARPQIKNLGVSFLVAHETANNNADADAHYHYFQNIEPNISAHTFIDDNKILEIIPLDEKAWHVRYDVLRDNQMFGDDANDIAIGIELCRTGNFDKAYDRYVWYHAYLCKKYELNPKKDIVAHSTLDPSRRSDPQSWLEPNRVSWAEFIADVYNYYLHWEDEIKLESKPSKPAKPEGVRAIGTDLTGARIENVYSENVNYYDTPRWNNPSGTFKPGHGWIIVDKYLVHGSPMYQVKNSKGDKYFITAHPKFVQVVGSMSNESGQRINQTMKAGDKVYLRNTAKRYYTGQTIPSKYKGKIYTVQQAEPNKVLLQELYSWVYKRDLQGYYNELTDTLASFIDRRVESIHNGRLRFYKQPSWSDKHVVGHLEKGEGFPTIINKLKVGNGYQYKVKNSKGVIYYVTASNKYVRVE